MILNKAKIVLGVTGGIAVYKALELCSRLVQSGAEVDVIMTEAATQFVAPLPFQTISQRPVSIDAFQLLRDTDMAHISLAQKANALLIAPATANTIAKLALGVADNLLTSTALACTAPLVIAPAMDADMWAHEATQSNVHLLQQRGATIVGPAHGRLASGRVGAGRLIDTASILGALRQALGRNGLLAGLCVAVTAGGTQEPLDPVRHLTNRSSGRMGYALAEIARDMGAQVMLISAPTALEAPYGTSVVPVRTAADMHAAVMAALPDIDVLVMAAAVADYRPAQLAEQKIKKADEELVLNLERTQDILKAVGQRRVANDAKLVVGFAAETENLIENARAKLESKRLDMIVANDVSSADSGFGVPDNQVTLLTPGAPPEALPLLPKEEVAELILTRVAEMWRRSHG